MKLFNQCIAQESVMNVSLLCLFNVLTIELVSYQLLILFQGFYGNQWFKPKLTDSLMVVFWKVDMINICIDFMRRDGKMYATFYRTEL